MQMTEGEGRKVENKNGRENLDRQYVDIQVGNIYFFHN